MTDASADPRGIIASLSPSPVRVGMGLVVNGGLAVLLLWIAFRFPPEVLTWQALLVAAGLYSAWTTWSAWQHRHLAILMTDTALTDTAGREICRIDEIDRVDRGVFAFKPARGFVLRLKAPRGRAWVPGIWWRFGRRVGIGGVTSAGGARLMAEMIDATLARRRGEI